jgi:hypothetical protein
MKAKLFLLTAEHSDSYVSGSHNWTKTVGVFDSLELVEQAKEEFTKKEQANELIDEINDSDAQYNKFSDTFECFYVSELYLNELL